MRIVLNAVIEYLNDLFGGWMEIKFGYNGCIKQKD